MFLALTKLPVTRTILTILSFYRKISSTNYLTERKKCVVVLKRSSASTSLANLILLPILTLRALTNTVSPTKSGRLKLIMMELSILTILRTVQIAPYNK